MKKQTNANLGLLCDMSVFWEAEAGIILDSGRLENMTAKWNAWSLLGFWILKAEATEDV